MRQYLDLVEDILKNGFDRKDRTGTGTIGVFGRQLKFKMSEGFPLVTTKRIHVKSLVHELLWFLNGGTNIKYLNDNGVTIWDEWADKDGELGPIYGFQWRGWRKFEIKPGLVSLPSGLYNENYWDESIAIDQINNLINTLKNNPDDRRMIVSAWNVGELDQMNLPPCHYSFQVNTRELSLEERISISSKEPSFDPFDFGIGPISDESMHQTCDLYKVPRRAISLMWNQRSVDVGLGLPFNIASYALLLMMIAQVVNMVPDELIASLGDTHIYKNHIKSLKLQMSRNPNALPKMILNTGHTDMDNWKFEDFNLIDYNCYPSIKMDISV